jgi:hypothetical protein
MIKEGGDLSYYRNLPIFLEKQFSLGGLWEEGLAGSNHDQGQKDRNEAALGDSGC